MHAALHPLDNVIAFTEHLKQRDLPQGGGRHALLLHLQTQMTTQTELLRLALYAASIGACC